MSTTLHPQYITDEAGKRVSVVLPIEEFEALTERLEDLEDLADAREALDRLHQGTEETIPWEAIKGEHGL
jgi:predicted DNA-binding protein